MLHKGKDILTSAKQSIPFPSTALCVAAFQKKKDSINGEAMFTTPSPTWLSDFQLMAEYYLPSVFPSR